MSKRLTPGKSIYEPKRPYFKIYDMKNGTFLACRGFKREFTYSKYCDSLEEAYAFLKRNEFEYTPEKSELINIAML